MVSCAKKIEDPCLNKPAKTVIKQNINDLICFESIDSYDLNYKDKDTVIINGELFYPSVERDNYNAVIMTHGSGGKRRYHKKYIELLTDMGLVVFQIDHYRKKN